MRMLVSRIQQTAAKAMIIFQTL